jgi:small subunit ribosomal protein S6
LKAELDADQTAALVEKYQTLVTEHGGQIDQLQEIGKRRLAYEIQDLREGYYVLMQFSSDTDVTKELERVMKIEENLLRYMTVRLGE